MSAGNDRLRIVLLGTLASSPYAGMAWMHMQIAVGLMRLGHDVHYVEATSVWPYDPIRKAKVNDSDYAVPYLRRVAEEFGFGDRWAYRRSFSDGEWLGPAASVAERLLVEADLVLNVAAATCPRREGLGVGRLVYFGTHPPYQDLAYAQGDPRTRETVDQHDDFVTYGENIGTPHSSVPPLPALRARTRQPVLVDMWSDGRPQKTAFTTVCNWKQEGHDLEFEGETYRWSKRHELLKFLELPLRAPVPLELAMGLADESEVQPGFGEMIPAAGMTQQERKLLDANGWHLVDAHAFTTDPWSYRDYVRASRGEFSVAKDQNVRLRTGWFSERSACYLAAGRPVITQDTGFDSVLPTGEGLFAVNTVDQAVAALETVESDYERHSRAARELAEEHFRAETVLQRLLEDLGA
jgi:hypothetical protein